MSKTPATAGVLLANVESRANFARSKLSNFERPATLPFGLEFHDFSIAHARNRPDTADVAPLLALQAFNLRSPIERPTSSFSISRAIRRRVAGAPARSRHSSLRSHAENKIPPSAIPLGKTSGCRPSASHACKLSFLTRRTPASPLPETPDANGCENAVRFSV